MIREQVIQQSVAQDIGDTIRTHVLDTMIDDKAAANIILTSEESSHQKGWFLTLKGGQSMTVEAYLTADDMKWPENIVTLHSGEKHLYATTKTDLGTSKFIEGSLGIEYAIKTCDFNDDLQVVCNEGEPVYRDHDGETIHIDIRENFNYNSQVDVIISSDTFV